MNVEILHAIDPSTQFLDEIIENLEAAGISFNVTRIEATDESYLKGRTRINEFKISSFVLFLGHGQSNCLYGGELLPYFEKKPFIRLNEMTCFRNHYLFLLSCDSSNLLKSYSRVSGIVKSIGFGGLPTSKEEIDIDRRLSKEGINLETIDRYKALIVELVSKALIFALSNNHCEFEELKNYLTLLIDAKISMVILEERNRNLAGMLYKMRTELVIY